MKKSFFIILGLLIFISSCTLFVDKDTTGNISMVSCKPNVELNGTDVMSLPVGGTYEELGVTATACDTPLSYTIVSGNVDASKAGFYLVEYRAQNAFGWATYAYRAVLVYNGQPYVTNIGGAYRKSFAFSANVSKYTVDGFWYMDNAWIEEGVTFPIVFAEDPNNASHFIIVPGEHPDKGKYSGTAVFQSNKLIIYLHIIPFEGDELDKIFEWTKS